MDKLAKELKEAGFPQNYDRLDKLDKTVPSLSELIEACGDRIEALIHDIGAKEWTATSFNAMGGTKLKIGRGKTPEIAVAKLWLELNKK